VAAAELQKTHMLDGYAAQNLIAYIRRRDIGFSSARN
jgi:hypothetical protein